MMDCLITSLGFELFENIIHMELHSTLTNNEAIGNVAITKRSCVCVRPTALRERGVFTCLTAHFRLQTVVRQFSPY